METIELSQLRSKEKTSHIFDHRLNIDHGKGIVRFLKLDLGFRVVVIDCVPTNNLKLNLYNTNKKFIYFLYCTEGLVYHKFANDVKLSRVDELSLSIVGSNKNHDAFLMLKPGRDIKLHLLCMDRSVFFKEYISKLNIENREVSKTGELFKALDNLNDYVYNCAKNLKFAEALRSILPLEASDNFLELLDLKSSYLHILSLYLNEFYRELYVERPLSDLSTYELQQIRKCSEFIIDHLDNQHSIKLLCQYSGLSPAKLQEGFKSMHGTTVSDFIRNLRLDKAESLFLNTDYNVSEVVYMVGIVSRSYFCKIFKQKFGVTPNQFRKNIKKKKSPKNLKALA